MKEKAKSRVYFAYNNLILRHALYMLLLVQSVSIVLYFEDWLYSTLLYVLLEAHIFRQPICWSHESLYKPFLFIWRSNYLQNIYVHFDIDWKIFLYDLWISKTTSDKEIYTLFKISHYKSLIAVELLAIHENTPLWIYWIFPTLKTEGVTLLWRMA